MESLRIDMKGVFKIKKNQKKTSGRRINEYGDEKIIREGDFYKPSQRGSPFYNGESVPVKFLNSSGINHNQ